MKKPFSVDTRSLEFFIALLSLLFAAWFWLPQDTFGSSVTYNWLAEKMPENVIGLIMFAAGLANMLALWIGDRTIRRVSTSTFIVVWGLLTWSAAVSNIASTATITWFSIVFACLFCSMFGD
jgi:hypothetical protein